MAWRLRSRFAQVLLNDIDPRIPVRSHRDLRRRALWEMARPDWCVSNPPFYLAGETLNLALDHCRRGVALLLRLSAIEVCKGREFLELYPPQRTIVLPRIKFRGKGTDTATVAWFVWGLNGLRLRGRPLVCVSKRTARRLAWLSTPAGVLLPQAESQRGGGSHEPAHDLRTTCAQERPFQGGRIMADLVPIRHFHLFCGVGGGALGFNRGEARVGRLVAQFQCLGGIDSDASACRDFTRLVGTPASCIDLFNREQYERFHGKKPPPGWREATVDDVRKAAGGQRPDIVFTSPPCKGFSGLLSTEKSRSPKYEALNELVLRGLLLALEAWADEPPPLLLMENVPRIQQRGRSLLDRVAGLLAGYGYASRETVHDAGELGGLAQHRRRFLLVARHQTQVPSFLYEPGRRTVRAIGEILSQLPAPGGEDGGPASPAAASDLGHLAPAGSHPAGQGLASAQGPGPRAPSAG